MRKEGNERMDKTQENINLIYNLFFYERMYKLISD